MNPLTSIWLSPRNTMRSLEGHDTRLLRFLLIWAWGAAYALDRATSGDTAIAWPFPMQIVLPLCVGLLGGALYFYAMGFAIEVTNSWFSGSASSRDIRRALIYGGVPKSASLLGYAALAIVFGREMFGSDVPADMPLLVSICYYTLTLGIFGLAIWSVFTTSHALAEVQGYRSAWRAYFHTVVAFLLMVLVIAIPLILWTLLISPT